MDQKIFELGLPMETVSVYLMCTGLADQDERLSLEILESLWNGGVKELMEGLDKLNALGIVELTGADSPCYRLCPSESWKKT